MKLNFFLLTLFVFVLNIQSQAQAFQNPYDNLGVMHNDGCKRVLQSLSVIPQSGHCKPIVESVLRPIWGDAYFEGYYSIPEFATFQQMISFINTQVSPSLSSEIAGWNSFLTTQPTVDMITARAKDKEQQAATLLSQNEKEMYYKYLAIMKSSAKFWLPISKGGENGTVYGPQTGTNGGTQNWTWPQWDAAGMLVGGMFGGPAGAIGGAVVASIAGYAYDSAP